MTPIIWQNLNTLISDNLTKQSYSKELNNLQAVPVMMKTSCPSIIKIKLSGDLADVTDLNSREKKAGKRKKVGIILPVATDLHVNFYTFILIRQLCLIFQLLSNIYAKIDSIRTLSTVLANLCFKKLSSMSLLLS